MATNPITMVGASARTILRILARLGSNEQPSQAVQNPEDRRRDGEHENRTPGSST